MIRPVVTVLMLMLLKLVCPKDDEYFKVIISASLQEGVTNEKELANKFGVSRPTIKRWASGESVPHPAMRSHVYRWLAEKLDKV